MANSWNKVENFNQLLEYPQITNTEKHQSASDHYEQVVTMDVLEVADRFGWKPSAVAAKGDKFGLHAIKLEHPNYRLDTGDKVQMIVSNSHDRTRAFSLDAGIYRLVCSNGLIIPIQEFANISQRHIGFDSMELMQELMNAIENVDELAPTVRRMNQVDLTLDQRQEIAFRSLIERLGEEELASTVDLDEFLTPRRMADMYTDLWTTYNVVQEKIISGNFEYEVEKDGQKDTRKARRISAFKSDMDINRKLYGIANEYLPA